MKFWLWLKHNVFRVGEGERMPWYVLAAKCIVYPSMIGWLITKRTAYYDPERNVFQIFGNEYSEELFRALGPGGLKIGATFKLVQRENGLVTFQEIKSHAQDFFDILQRTMNNKEKFLADRDSLCKGTISITAEEIKADGEGLYQIFEKKMKKELEGYRDAYNLCFGYQPTRSNLDPANPPQGGSGVPNLRGTQ